MIQIGQRPVPRSRTQTGSPWEASTEIDGKTCSATSRHGGPQALARVLIAAGNADQPVEVRSEVCVFDNGAECAPRNYAAALGNDRSMDCEMDLHRRRRHAASRQVPGSAGRGLFH